MSTTTNEECLETPGRLSLCYLSFEDQRVDLNKNSVRFAIESVFRRRRIIRIALAIR